MSKHFNTPPPRHATSAGSRSWVEGEGEGEREGGGGERVREAMEEQRRGEQSDRMKRERGRR